MRLEVKIGFKDQLELPMHYNHIVQGFIYNNIEDEIFRTFLHEEGFQHEKRSFKLFTFSRLIGHYRINSRKNTITFNSPITLIVSSVVGEFIDNFANSLIKSDNLFLGRTQVHITGISTYDYDKSCRSGIITMLSPMTAYSTVTLLGKKKTIYHNPHSEVFSKLLCDNLRKKYKVIHNRDG